MSAESSKMIKDWPFASEANYALGNYVTIQQDATTPKVYRDGNEMLGDNYSSNSFIGRSLYNTLLSGRNAVLSCIGDSTSAKYIEYLAQKFGELGICRVVHNKYSTSNEYLNTQGIYGLTPSADEEVGFDFSGSGGTIQYTGDVGWTSPDIGIELRFSNYDTSKTNIYLGSKWDNSVSANKSWYLRAEGADLRFTWYTGSSEQATVISNVFAGQTLTDIKHIRIRAIEDEAGTSKLYIDTTVDGGITWDLGTFSTVLGNTTFSRTTVSNFFINSIAGSQANTVKIHKFVIYNGSFGETLTPINLEQWDIRSNSATTNITGTVPTLYIVDGGIGGLAFADYDATLLAKTTVPDTYQTMIINHGHNSDVSGTIEEFTTEINDFLTRLNTKLVDPQLIIDNQNPEQFDITIPFRANAFRIKGSVLRTLANKYNYGCIDTQTAWIDSQTDWENELMEDAIHPNDVGYSLRALYAINYITGR